MNVLGECRSFTDTVHSFTRRVHPDQAVLEDCLSHRRPAPSETEEGLGIKGQTSWDVKILR